MNKRLTKILEFYAFTLNNKFNKNKLYQKKLKKQVQQVILASSAIGKQADKMKDNLRKSMSRYFTKIKNYFKNKTIRTCLIYIVLVIINIFQFLYVHNIFPTLMDQYNDESSNSNSSISEKSNENKKSEYCISQKGKVLIYRSDFPGTCIQITNVRGLSILYIFIIIDVAFNIFSVTLLQCRKNSKINLFLNQSYQKTAYNLVENIVQFFIIYYGDDKLMGVSFILLFIKNILSIQYNLNRGRILQIITILSGILINVIFREWNTYLIVMLFLSIVEVFATVRESVYFQYLIDTENEKYDVDDPYINQNEIQDDNQGYNTMRRSSKKWSCQNVRSFSKKKIDNSDFPQRSYITNLKGNSLEINAAQDKSYKNESNIQFLSDLSKNIMYKSEKKGSVSQSQLSKHNFGKKSSLDNIVTRKQSNQKQNQKDVLGDNSNQYTNFGTNNRDFSNTNSTGYELNSQIKKKQFMKYKTAHQTVKNDEIITNEQYTNRKANFTMSSAGQIPISGKQAFQNIYQNQKSRYKILKKTILNISDIKGINCSERFSFQKNNSKASKYNRSLRHGSLNSKRKIDIEDINTVDKKNYVSSSNISQKKNSPIQFQPAFSLVSPARNNNDIHPNMVYEDVRNQFSTRNFLNSSNRILYDQQNYDTKNQQQGGSLSVLSDRPSLLLGATVRERADEDRNEYEHSSDSDNNEPATRDEINIKDFYGMFFQILSEGIVLFNFENGDININNTLKRLLNNQNEKECIETLFSLKNASLQPLNSNNTCTFDRMRSTVHGNNCEDGQVANSNINPEVNQLYSSFLNINSYMYDNSVFTASKNKAADDQTTQNYKQSTQKSQKSINIYSNQTQNNQITNSNNINDDLFSQIKRRHSTSSHNKTNTLMSKKTSRFLYKKDEDDLNSSIEMESPFIKLDKIKRNSGMNSSKILGVQIQKDSNSISQVLEKNNINIKNSEILFRTEKFNFKTDEPLQKQPDSGIQIEEYFNQDYNGNNNQDRLQMPQPQLMFKQNESINNLSPRIEEGGIESRLKDYIEENKFKDYDKNSYQQGQPNSQSPKHNKQKDHQNPNQKIIYSVAKEFTVKDQFEKIEEDMQDYKNESNFEMLGHHIKMLCKLDKYNPQDLNQSKYQEQQQILQTTSGGITATTPTGGQYNNINLQNNSAVSYNTQSSLNPFQHQNSQGFKNKKTSRFSNLSALNAFQQQTTIQQINQYQQQQQLMQAQQKQDDKKEERKIIEITFIPCFVNQQQCLVLIVKDVSHFNSIKVLKDMNENRSKMLNYVVHEIRSPLNSITNYLNSSIEHLTKELHENYIDPALSGAQMLNVLIQDLLDMAQMKAGKYRLNIRPFKIDSLIEDVIKTMKVIVKQKSPDISLDSNIDPQITADISSDYLRIKQILINLISNASKFTDEGSIKIEVQMVENRIYRFSVRDTGIGITEEQKKKLFSEFSKIETQETDILNPKGVGLGLVISNTLAKSLSPKNMSVGLEILSGKQIKGSEFYFHILDFSQGNSTALPNNNLNTMQSDLNNASLRAGKYNQTTPQNNKIINSSFISHNLSQLSPQNNHMAIQQFQNLKTNTQIINSLVPYSQGANNQNDFIEQDQIAQDQESNKWTQNHHSSAPSSNSSSPSSSRKNSVFIPNDEEEMRGMCIHSIAPKFRKKQFETISNQNVNGQQPRFLSSSVDSSEQQYFEMQGNKLQQNESQIININNYSFIQNSLSRDNSKPQINNSINQSQPQQGIQFYKIPSSYLNADENNPQPSTPCLQQNSIQSLKFGIQSSQHNTHPLQLQQQDGIQKTQSFEQNLKKKSLCNCSNILVVDDEPFQCNSQVTLIHSITKSSCDKASNSVYCEKQIKNKHQNNSCCPLYILIFLDLNMFPSKDGFETLIEIQNYHHINKLIMPKVVACTGEADEEKKQQCIIAGFDDILEKPIQINQLKQILQTYLLSYQQYC